MRQLIFLLTIILVIEYYSFIALKTVIRNLNHNLQISLIVGYVLLTLGVVASIYSFFHWRSDVWSSAAIKLTVNFFVGVFLGKLLVSIIMLIGDIFVLGRLIVNYLFALVSVKSELSEQGRNLISRSRFISQTALVLGGLLISALAYGMTNRYRYKLHWVQVPAEKLPDEFRGIRIAQISDIHSGSFDDLEAVSAGVDAVMREKPDLILVTGDLVNNRSEEISPYLEVFKRLTAPLGVYSVLGNHDYGDYVKWLSPDEKRRNLEQLKKHQAAMGWRLLLNEHVLLRRNQAQIALIGVENWGARGFTKYGDLRKATAGLEDSGVAFKILMSHDPSHWDAEVRQAFPDIALTLSGHTHGMQFGIEMPGLKWSPVQYLYKQWAGLYQEGSQYLYVNRGFGFIGYQGRFGILPEITVIDLV